MVQVLDGGIRSAQYPRSLFVYSSYWGKWSRVLQYKNGHKPQVEVDCEPVNLTQEGWRRVGSILIRQHSTARRQADYYYEALPYEVVETMQENISEIAMLEILHGDLLPLIDWEKYRRVDNGGATLADILRD